MNHKTDSTIELPDLEPKKETKAAQPLGEGQLASKIAKEATEAAVEKTRL